MTSRAARNVLGKTGESIARTAAIARGLQILDANWHCAAGELDIVGWDGSELVIVEVKTRVSEGAGSAEESLSDSKCRRLARAAEWYVSDHPELDSPIWRIDLLAITLAPTGAVRRTTWIENAVVDQE